MESDPTGPPVVEFLFLRWVSIRKLKAAVSGFNGEYGSKPSDASFNGCSPSQVFIQRKKGGKEVM